MKRFIECGDRNQALLFLSAWTITLRKTIPIVCRTQALRASAPQARLSIDTADVLTHPATRSIEHRPGLVSVREEP